MIEDVYGPSVYLIGNERVGYCKIGRSGKPWLRLHTLDTPKLPFPLYVLAMLRVGAGADVWMEPRLHKAFKNRRLRGEWFTGISSRGFMRKANALYKEYKETHETETQGNPTQSVS